jgi:glutathione S-transferase
MSSSSSVTAVAVASPELAPPLEVFLDYPLDSEDYLLQYANPECIALQMYVNAIKLKPVVRFSRYPYSNLVKGSCMPVLKWHDTVVADKDWLPYLKRHYCDIDQELERAQRSDIDAYVTFVTDALRPVCDFVMWEQNVVYHHATSRYYADKVPWPASSVIRLRVRSEKRKQLKLQRLDKDVLVEAHLRVKLKVLSSKLGKRAFLFGEAPSSADFVMAAYIAFLFHFPSSLLPIDVLADQLSRKLDKAADAKKKDPSSLLAQKRERGITDVLSIKTILCDEFPNLLRHALCLLYFYFPRQAPSPGAVPSSSSPSSPSNAAFTDDSSIDFSVSHPYVLSEDVEQEMKQSHGETWELYHQVSRELTYEMVPERKVQLVKSAAQELYERPDGGGVATGNMRGLGVKSSSAAKKKKDTPREARQRAFRNRVLVAAAGIASAIVLTKYIKKPRT